jgi:hypothetical protein
MAVSKTLHGAGLGEYLLMNALERSLLSSRQIASWTVLVDAKLGASGFYLNQRFLPFRARPERLFLPIYTIEKLFNS